MRCPDCNKFVSYDEPQTEVQSVEIEAEEALDHECKPEGERGEDAKPDADFKEGDEQYEIENDGDAEGTSRTETKDRHGKPIKSSRYIKSFYGFTLETEVKCLKCGQTFGVQLEGEQQASSFNEY